ncbi:Transposase IS4 family protein [Hoyosella subflava DQS3-9A1]|uniref:Transposase IS4 family protein n=1 Tax=Hoyosella subflava (strain DSM 45089 / JCM 17490 / NBRC 109087 / DQS3-9A1) TaxID=443218 RepID=F6EHW5_HOYSD|nr:Transposase IS4 family protein [Hoyosella subflava DQS3-9A1]
MAADNLSGWLAGMRVLVRKKRPHPSAQLRFTGCDGHGLTAFATNTSTGQLADLELRHRQRARCEDRIRTRTPADTPQCGELRDGRPHQPGELRDR